MRFHGGSAKAIVHGKNAASQERSGEINLPRTYRTMPNPKQSTKPSPAAILAAQAVLSAHEEPRSLTEEEAARRHSLSINTIRRWRLGGKIRAFALGPRLVRIDRESLDGFVAELSRGGDSGKKGVAKGICGAWRSRRNLRLKTAPAVASVAATGDAANA